VGLGIGTSLLVADTWSFIPLFEKWQMEE